MTNAPPEGTNENISFDERGNFDVVRSGEWHIAVADVCSVAFLGRDYALSTFAMMPQIQSFSKFREGKVGPGEISANQVYVETAQIRLSPPAAVHIIGNLLSNMRINEPDVFNLAIESLSEFFDNGNGK